MLDLDPLITTFRAQMVAAAPDLTVVREAEHANMVPWTTLTLPFGVILASNVQRSPDAPITQTEYEFDADLIIVREVLGPSSAMRADLEALTAAFWPKDGTGRPTADPLEAAGVGQVLYEPSGDYGDAHPINQLLRSANRSQRAVIVRVHALTAV